MPRKYRSMRTSLEDEEDAETREKAKEKRMEQMMRSRTSGVGAEELLQAREDDLVVRRAALENRLDEEKRLESGLQFKQERLVDAKVEDPNMVKYVEERFAMELGKERLPERRELSNPLHKMEQELYQIPDHLKAPIRKESEGPTWTTGIQEVELPVEYKLQNIRETEKAAQARMRGGKEQEGGISQEEEKDKRRSRMKQGAATDDQVAKRFRRRELERFGRK